MTTNSSREMVYRTIEAVLAKLFADLQKTANAISAFPTHPCSVEIRIISDDPAKGTALFVSKNGKTSDNLDQLLSTKSEAANVH